MRKLVPLLLLATTLLAQANPDARKVAARLDAEGTRLQYSDYSLMTMLLNPKPLENTRGRDQALLKFTQAINICPDYGPAYAHRAALEMMSLHSQAAAAADARRAAKYGGLEDTDWMMLSACVPGERSRFLLEGARQSRTASGRRMLEGQLATSYYLDGKYAEAVKTFRTHPPDGYENYFYGLSLEALGHYAEAELAYRKLARASGRLLFANPFKPQAAEGIIRSRLARRDYPGAKKAITEFAADLPAGQEPLYRGLTQALAGEPVPHAAKLARKARDPFMKGVLQHAAGDPAARKTLQAFCRFPRRGSPWQLARARALL